MIRIKSNIKLVSASIINKLAKLKDKEYLLRPIAFDVIDIMTKRIHLDGRASDESQIGDYSPSYLKRRISKYNRNNDPKIIVSLTRQLENDWAVIATEKGYGIGFLNAFNAQKARWVEEGKDKAIFSLTIGEQEFVRQELAIKVQNALKGQA